MHLFLHSSLSRSPLSNPSLQFRSSFPSFPLYFLSMCSRCQFFISHSFYMTSPCQTMSSKFRLKMSFTPTSSLGSFVLFLLTLLPPTILRTRLVSQTYSFCSCFSVSAIAPFVYAGVTHELITSPLCLRELCLSPITSSTLLQALNFPCCKPHYNQSKLSSRFCPN